MRVHVYSTEETTMPAASTVSVVRTEAVQEESLAMFLRYTGSLLGKAEDVLGQFPVGSLPDSHIEVWHGNKCPAPDLGLCGHCYLGQGNKGDETSRLSSPPEHYLRALETIAHQGQFTTVPMVGIEPSASSWTLPLMQAITSVGLVPALTTSGIGLTKEKVQALAGAGVKTVCFSYDASPLGHGTQEDKPAHMISRLAPIVVQEGMDAVGMVTILPNAGSMVDTVRHLTSLGCAMVSFHPVEGPGVEPNDTELFAHHRASVRADIANLLSVLASGALEDVRVHLEAGAKEAWMLFDSMALFREYGFVLASEVNTGKVYLNGKFGTNEVHVNLSLVRGTENIRILSQPSGVGITTCRAVCRRLPPVPWHVWEGDLSRLANTAEWQALIHMEQGELRQGLARLGDAERILHGYVDNVGSFA